MIRNYHNKGQGDAGKKTYNPPHGTVKELVFGWGKEGHRMYKENSSYRQGYMEGKRKRR